MALIYMLWVGAVRMEMSKISSNAMGIITAFFIHDCRNLCCFFEQDRKKTHQNQDFRNWEPAPKTKALQKLLCVGTVTYWGAGQWWGVMCPSQTAKVKARETFAAWPWARANTGLCGAACQLERGMKQWVKKLPPVQFLQWSWQKNIQIRHILDKIRTHGSSVTFSLQKPQGPKMQQLTGGQQQGGRATLGALGEDPKSPIGFAINPSITAPAASR